MFEQILPRPVRLGFVCSIAFAACSSGKGSGGGAGAAGSDASGLGGAGHDGATEMSSNDASAGDSAAKDGDVQPPVPSEIGKTCDTSPRASFGTVVTPNAVYLVEGIPVDQATPLSTTAMIGRTGDASLDLATCNSVSGVTVPVAEYAMGVATVASSVYLIGGNTTGTTTTQNAVYRAEIANGSLSSFAVATLPGDGGVTPVVLQTSRYGAEVLQIQNYVYVIGGWSSVGQAGVATIERAQVDLTTGSFVTNFAPAIDPNTASPATMAVPRFDTVAVHLGSWVYVLGGQSEIGNAAVCHNEIQRASVDANGNLSTFSQVGTLASLLCEPAIYAAGETLYVLGGLTSINYPGNPAATDAVLQAPIATDGTLGTLILSSAKLSYPVGSAGSAVLGNAVYLFNGFKGNTGATTSIQALTFP